MYNSEWLEIFIDQIYQYFLFKFKNNSSVQKSLQIWLIKYWTIKTPVYLIGKFDG